MREKTSKKQQTARRDGMSEKGVMMVRGGLIGVDKVIYEQHNYYRVARYCKTKLTHLVLMDMSIDALK